MPQIRRCFSPARQRPQNAAMHGLHALLQSGVVAAAIALLGTAMPAAAQAQT